MDGPDPHGSKRLATSLALASAFGIALGFLPKDSLAFYALLCAAVLAPTHLVWLASCSLVFHLLGGGCAPLFHKFGAILLTDPRLLATWAYLAELPVLPWTRFNHTGAMGAMVLSLVLFWPAFLLSFPLFSRIAPRVQAALVASMPYQWLMRDDVPVSEARR